MHYLTNGLIVLLLSGQAALTTPAQASAEVVAVLGGKEVHSCVVWEVTGIPKAEVGEMVVAENVEVLEPPKQIDALKSRFHISNLLSIKGAVICEAFGKLATGTERKRKLLLKFGDGESGFVPRFDNIDDSNAYDILGGRLAGIFEPHDNARNVGIAWLWRRQHRSIHEASVLRKDVSSYLLMPCTNLKPRQPREPAGYYGEENSRQRGDSNAVVVGKSAEARRQDPIRFRVYNADSGRIIIFGLIGGVLTVVILAVAKIFR